MPWYLATILALFLLSTAYAAWIGAPWFPSGRRMSRLFVQNIQMQPGEQLIDLGCGSAGVLIQLSKQFPQNTFVGIELSLPLFFFAWIRALPHANLRIRYGNFFHIDLSSFDHIFLYQQKKLYTKLRHHIKHRAKTKASVHVVAWPFEHIEPDHVLSAEQMLSVYTYSVSKL